MHIGMRELKHRHDNYFFLKTEEKNEIVCSLWGWGSTPLVSQQIYNYWRTFFPSKNSATLQKMLMSERMEEAASFLQQVKNKL